MLKIILATGAVLALTTPVHAGSWTASNSNGGSGSGATTCVQGEGALLCTTTGSWTGAKGRTGSWVTERSITRDRIEGHRTSTGPNGKQRSLTFTRDRRN